MQDTKHKLQDTKHKMQGVEQKLQGAEHNLHVTDHKLQLILSKNRKHIYMLKYFSGALKRFKLFQILKYLNMLK